MRYANLSRVVEVTRMRFLLRKAGLLGAQPAVVFIEDLGVEYARSKHQWTLNRRGFGFDVAARIWEDEVVNSDVLRPQDGELRNWAIGKVLECEPAAFARAVA